MERYNLQNLSVEVLYDIPKSAGLVAFYKQAECLYLVLSMDIHRTIARLIATRDTQSSFGDLMAEADYCELSYCDSPIKALIAFKQYLAQTHPTMQQQGFATRDYVYLGLNSARFPFISIADYTIGEWNFVGPFRSKFFLADYIDSLSRILKLPHCETGVYPCDKFDQDICRGWCLNLSPSSESDTARDLDKLERLLFESYMTPTETVISMLQQEHDKYFDALEFEKADLIGQALRVHHAYRDWLNFLIAAKTLSFKDDLVLVENGQLVEAFEDGAWIRFPSAKVTYNATEVLALDKSMVDESKILYDYINNKIEKR